MANFCNYPKGERITEITIPNSMNLPSRTTTVGLWGFLDFEGQELQLLAPPYISVKKGDIRGRIRLYELSSYHPGRFSVDAITQAGAVWDRLTVFVKDRQNEKNNSEWSGDSSSWTQEKKLLSLNPSLRSRVEQVLAALRDQGFQPKIFFGWRSVAVQQELYRKGVTKVKFSFHNAQKPDGTPNSYAADIVDARWGWEKSAELHGFWTALGNAAKGAGLVWGGDWKDFRDVAHVQSRQNSELAAAKQESGL